MGSESRTYFLANACHICKSKKTSITCDICKMIFYCSPEHRRSNWFDHSQICWAINKICESGRCECLWELHNGMDFTKFKHQVAGKCAELLKRSLKSWELEMIYHPRVCNVCGETNWKYLSSCKNCEFVYACEKKHFREDHKKWCKTMKLYSDVIIHQSLTGKGSIKLSEFEIGKDVLESMTNILSKSCNFKNQYQNVEVQKAFVSEILTYPLTVLHALKHIGAVKKPEIKILFIGAEVQAEVEPVSKWEEFLLHFLGDARVLSLTFLGPELGMTSEKWSKDLCETCRQRGSNLKIEFASGVFYHEYSANGESQPDLICALNSGMYRDFGFGNENSWKETIQQLFLRGNSPVLITEYTSRELKMVLEKISTYCGNVKTIVQPKMNPFASLKPGLNIISNDETPVIFKNYFYTVLQKK